MPSNCRPPRPPKTLQNLQHSRQRPRAPLLPLPTTPLFRKSHAKGLPRLTAQTLVQPAAAGEAPEPNRLACGHGLNKATSEVNPRQKPHPTTMPPLWHVFRPCHFRVDLEKTSAIGEPTVSRSGLGETYGWKIGWAVSMAPWAGVCNWAARNGEITGRQDIASEPVESHLSLQQGSVKWIGAAPNELTEMLARRSEFLLR